MKNFKAETIVSKLFNAVTARVQALRDAELVVSSEFKKILDHYAPEGKHYRSFVACVDTVRDVIDFDLMLKIIQKHKPQGANDAQYMQAKTIEKVNKFITGLGQKDFRLLDNHTRSLVVNAMLNDKRLTSRAAFASLVKVQWSEEISEVLRERNNYTVGTGSTQLSSTKEMMRTLKLSDGIKGSKSADFTFSVEAETLFIERFEQIAKLVRTSEEISTEIDDVEGIEA